MATYDKEFKKNAVRTALIALENGKPIGQTAKEYGINLKTFYQWVHKYKNDSTNCFVGSGNLKPEDAEIKRLKKELSDALEENAILKKAAAYFAKNQK